VAEYVSVGYKLTAAAGVEGDVTLFKVPSIDTTNAQSAFVLVGGVLE